MTPALSCPDAEIALGALVLGALDPSEREQVEAHVRSCPRCAEALAEIAPLPGLLHRAGPTSSELEPAPDAILERALAQVRAEQAQGSASIPEPAADPGGGPVAAVVPLHRRRLPLLAAAAVAVLALVLGGTWWSATHRTPSTITAAASSAASGVKAKVVMTPTDEGTTLDLTLSGVTPGEQCSLVVVGSDGSTEVASSWIANYEGEATITGATWLTAADIERFDIATPDGRTLLVVDVPA